MKFTAKLAVTCALSLVSGLQVAVAAVTCVENKATGKFVQQSANKAPGSCDAHLAMNMVSSAQDIEDLAAGSGTKVINGVIVTNAAKPFRTTPASEQVKAERPAPAIGASRVIETPEEMSLPGTPVRPAVASRPIETPAAMSLPGSPAKPVLAKAEPAKASQFDANSKADWVLKASYSTLEEALEDFAKRVNYEVVYEAREFPLGLKRDITIARGASFWEVLRVLGETYRKSDGAFQILPTKFNQIVVLPMGQNTANGQR